MSLCSIGHPQLRESLSRLVLSWSHSPCGFTALIEQTEGTGICRNRVHPEEMCSSEKGTCRTEGHLCFSPASPTHLLPACEPLQFCWAFAQRRRHSLERLLLQLSKSGCRRAAQFVAALSVQACAGSRVHLLLPLEGLEGLTQIASMILLMGWVPSATPVITSYLLSSSAAAVIRPSCVAWTVYFHWGPTTRGRACALPRCSGSHRPLTLLSMVDETFAGCLGCERIRSLQSVFKPFWC